MGDPCQKHGDGGYHPTCSDGWRNKVTLWFRIVSTCIMMKPRMASTVQANVIVQYTKLASQFWDLRIRPNKHCFTPHAYLHSRSRQFAYKTLVTSQWPRNAFMYMACAYSMVIVTCMVTLYGLTKHEKYELL